MTNAILGKTHLTVSRLGLGTAEIGFAYGIGERSLPSEKEAIDLLHRAVELGVTYFDTANYYQLSEKRIRKSGILKNKNVVVGTKCANFLEKGVRLTPAETKRMVSEEVDDSRKKLGLDSLPILMIHGPSKSDIESGIITDILGDLLSRKIILHAGVSTRGEEAPLSAAQHQIFRVLQIAYSIADQRMESRVLPMASNKNIGIINRSVLLKGSLTPLRKNLPSELAELVQTADKAEKIAAELGTSLPSLAIRFALSNDKIATSLVGTGNISNLEKSVKAAENGRNPAKK